MTNVSPEVSFQDFVSIFHLQTNHAVCARAWQRLPKLHETFWNHRFCLKQTCRWRWLSFALWIHSLDQKWKPGPKVYSNSCSWNPAASPMFFSCVFQGGAATEVYKMILKETGDAMSARVREVFQRRSLKRQSTHFGHSHMWMDGDDCSGAYSGDKGDDTKAIVQHMLR